MYINKINPFRVLKRDRVFFITFYFSGFLRTVYYKIFKKKYRSKMYCGRLVINHEDTNELLKKLIHKKDSFMFGRNGGNETLLYGYGVLLRKKMSEKPFFDIDLSAKQCGFNLIDSESIKRFSEIIEESTSLCDVYGTFRWICEDYLLLKNLNEKTLLTNANVMDFWNFDSPFTSALKGKKVLIVSAFSDLIERQYLFKDKLFPDKEWLPDFDLITYKPVQTIAGLKDERFDNWFEALSFMKEEIRKLNFDIALLSCGAYGMPLTAFIKNLGKQAIYMGGVLQILFGIRGKRWDSVPEVAKLYNSFWVIPEEKYKPKNADVVEDSCYW